MPSSQPGQEWKVYKKDHGGSAPEEIENEPDWGAAGHDNFTGYKNRYGRRPGHAEGDHHQLDTDIQEAREAFQRAKERKDKGDLVNWRDAIKGQKNLSLRHPEGHPYGWRYTLDYTEEAIRGQEKWPINVRNREAERKTQEQQKQDQKEQKQDQKEHNGGGGEGEDEAKDGEQEGAQGEDADEEQPSSDKDKESGDKTSPEEKEFLRLMKEERDYMTTLKSNDGTGRSNVRVRNRTSVCIDEADQFTPDNWIPRAECLIRLTGKHPLNAEPPLSALFDAGFITPNELFYVRSHGAVPKLLWELHQIEVCWGDKRRSFSMDEIKGDFEPINIPVSIGCDNGRRKEINMIKRTTGFNWGPAAVGCAYWKGPLLRSVLMAAGVPEHMPDEGTKRYWVQLRGADNPGAAKYETSVPFEYVMDKTNDVILAYEMNDAILPPDHGYPIRAIIPGYVGGRQVKWIEKIWITDKENESYFHIWDNRVVPSFVTNKDSELSLTMFHHPDTALYEQYLNSVIVRPSQGEKIVLRDVGKDKKYRVQGFAFNGRGDAIKRIEVTLDGGQTWRYCVRRFPEAPVRHAKKFWTWCFWHVDVDVGDLIVCDGIRVRAWDVKMVTQPEEPTWNLTGSMNNAQYVVKPQMINDDNPHVLFRHPVEPGDGKGGWMEDSAENQMADATRTTDAPNKQFTRAEVEKHDKEDDCWIAIDGRVYDATSVLSWHPGGPAPIMMHAGMVHYDTTQEFSSLHDDYAYEKLSECVLGVLTDKAKKYVEKLKKAKEQEASEKPPEDQALQQHKWTPATLVERTWISDDTADYKFELPEKTKYLGIGTCQHVQIGFHLKDRMLIRPYTPTKPVLPRDSKVDAGDDTARHDGTGTFQLTVKTYFPDDEQPGGALSNIMAAMPIGEEVEMRGPTGDIIYKGDGVFSIMGKERRFKRVSLVLGGTGLTPGYSLVARSCLDHDDKTEVRVIDCNKGEGDILLREDLDRFQEMSKGRVQITHVLSEPSEDWSGLKGYVNEKIMREHLFPPSDENLALLCGPPGMIEKAVVPVLEKWGYDQSNNMFGL
ncbi:hypothetical protein F4778DRAFT_773989 [Xylariomycetidae sp. FL2044]|nr:hypothetical protein F4778DRAFT_773989 [Xylariomycetidae sp. FL2044]